VCLRYKKRRKNPRHLDFPINLPHNYIKFNYPWRRWYYMCFIRVSTSSVRFSWILSKIELNSTVSRLKNPCPRPLTMGGVQGVDQQAIWFATFSLVEFVAVLVNGDVRWTSWDIHRSSVDPVEISSNRHKCYLI